MYMVLIVKNETKICCSHDSLHFHGAYALTYEFLCMFFWHVWLTGKVWLTFLLHLSDWCCRPGPSLRIKRKVQIEKKKNKNKHTNMSFVLILSFICTFVTLCNYMYLHFQM